MKRCPLKALLPILLAVLLLLNTLTVMAAEADEAPPAESPAVSEAVPDCGQPAPPEESEPDEPAPEQPEPDEPAPEQPEPEETPDAAPPDDSADSEPPPEDTVPEEPPLVWLEVDTFEELYEALEIPTPSETTRIRLTSNITVPAIEDECTSNLFNLIELDLGPYTLYVEGTLRLQSGVTLMGSPDEDAMIRVRPGGEANIHNVTIQAGDRCAVWQEEGAIFTFTPMSDFTGEVHFAERAVAIPYSFTSWKVAMPVAVVHDGQTLADVLPETDNVQLNHNGKHVLDAYIAVDWDTDDFREGLDSRTRTVITGSYPDVIAFQQPVCLVVFQNGNPAIFLDAYGMESSGWPKAKVKIELLEPALGCRFEWSQDGESWLPADAVETPSSDGRLAFTVSFPQETPPAYPYYLSAVVDYPDGSAGYSDVLVIQMAYSQCDSGGNRRGGTGVTPPELPPANGGTEEDDDSMESTPPDEPDHSDKPEGSSPPGGGTTDEPDGPEPPVVKPSIASDSPEQKSIPPTEPPGQPVPSPASPPASDAALPPVPQATHDVQEAMTQTVAEAPVRNEAVPRARTAAQVATGVVATGGIITLTMTWGSWSKCLIGLLHKLLKQ